MAQHNTDYGLVYDDDGKICVTKRTDIIPFSGVTSYAVETATTNYLAPHAWEFDSEQTLFYPWNLAEGKTWADCWDEKQKAYVGGHNLTCWVIYTRSIDLGSVQAAGTKITLSWKHKGYFWFVALSHSLDNVTFTGWNSADTLEFKGDSSFHYWEGASWLHIKIDGKITNYYGQPEQLLDRWYNVEITYTLPSDTRYIQLHWNFYMADQANGGLGVLGYVRQPQLEIKPFASSFVNGTRPNGRLMINKDKIGFNGIANHVFNFWVRNRYITTSEFFTSPHSTGHVIAEFVHDGTNAAIDGYYDGVIYIYKGSRTIYFKSPSGANRFYNIGSQEDYGDGEWIMFTVIFDPSGTSSIYINAVLKATGNIVYPLKNLTKNIYFMSDSYSSARGYSSMIANILVGKYKRDDGSIIWTPEYIQEIYQQRNGFFVPPKAVIV